MKMKNKKLVLAISIVTILAIIVATSLIIISQNSNPEGAQSGTSNSNSNVEFANPELTPITCVANYMTTKNGTYYIGYSSLTKHDLLFAKNNNFENPITIAQNVDSFIATEDSIYYAYDKYIYYTDWEGNSPKKVTDKFSSNINIATPDYTYYKGKLYFQTYEKLSGVVNFKHYINTYNPSTDDLLTETMSQRPEIPKFVFTKNCIVLTTSDNRINCLYYDDGPSLWPGTIKEAENITLYATDGEKVFGEATIEGKNKIFIIDANLKNKKFEYEFIDLASNTNIEQIYYYKNSIIYLTYTEGGNKNVNIYNLQDKTNKKLDIELSFENVYGTAQDGNFCVACNTGIYKITDGNGTTIKISDGFGTSKVRTLNLVGNHINYIDYSGYDGFLSSINQKQVPYTIKSYQL